MKDIIAVFNAGSSTLKFSVFAKDDLSPLHRQTMDVPEGGHEAALQQALRWISEHGDGMRLSVAGHRVVHGKDFAEAKIVSPALLAELAALAPLAPLHQPHNLQIIEALARLRPDLLQVACFDTAFHRTQPKLAMMFALPRHFYDEGVKRYGFHGISYEYIASMLPEVAGEVALGRVIVAHLGNGASACAMRGLKSVATSMGFSALDGLMMGTRCGTLDAGVVLYLQQYLGMNTAEVEDVLYRRSGLLGVSGLSGDMRLLEGNGTVEAEEAIALFCRRAAQEIGGLMAVLGGLDVLVFTGGIGEHSARVRRGICEYLGWVGLALDKEANQANRQVLHSAESAVKTYMIPTNEEVVIARAARAF